MGFCTSPGQSDWERARGNPSAEQGPVAASPTQAPVEDLVRNVPAPLRPRFQEIVALLDTFCDAKLNDEYKSLCREMLVVVCLTDLPVGQGKPAAWAAGVAYSVGWVNFLTDPSQEPHLRAEEIAKGLGVSVATMHARSKLIREELKLVALDPTWTLPSRMDSNPLVWILSVNGIPMDIRDAPRGAQEEAFRQGLIPYIPDDRVPDDE